VAARVAALDLPGVTVRSVIQLVPELVLDIVGVDRVIVVDADVGATSLTVTPVSLPVDPAEPVVGGPMDHPAGTGPIGRSALTHQVTPSALLGLVAATGHPPPAVHVVAVPAVDVGLGERLSAATETAVGQAVELIEDLVTGRLGEPGAG
jgi:Ni,Fe-hydrogenase maturation factor